MSSSSPNDSAVVASGGAIAREGVDQQILARQTGEPNTGRAYGRPTDTHPTEIHSVDPLGSGSENEALSTTTPTLTEAVDEDTNTSVHIDGDIPGGSSLTMTRIFETMQLPISEEHLMRLVSDFPDSSDGVEEFVALLGDNEYEGLLRDYDLMDAKHELLLFCGWFNRHYRGAGNGPQPIFNGSTWAAYLDASPSDAPVPSLDLRSTDDTSLLADPSIGTNSLGNVDIPSNEEHRLADQMTENPVAFPEAIRVLQVLDRYNRFVEEFLVPSLNVSWADVAEMYVRMKLMCPRGLVDSLVYSPRDLSVFVRTKLECGYVVDVSLCNNDETHRSNVRLDGDVVTGCDNRVGVIEHRRKVRRKVPNVTSLNPIVRHFVDDRVVSTIKCPTEHLCTISMAPTYNPNRISIPREVAASELWGNHGHDPIKFDFDRSSADRDLFAAWLICMTKLQRHTTENQQEAIQTFLAERYADFGNGKMTMSVNYEAMFRSKGPVYRSGRLSWPMILGICLAKNRKEDLMIFEAIDHSLRSKIGSYCGMFSEMHILCGVFSLVLMVAFLSVASVVVTRNDLDLLHLLPALFVLMVISIVSSNFYFLQDTRPWAFSDLDDRNPPEVGPADRGLAVRLLLSESCCRHFDGTNLSFTGETYSGVSKFGYRFTYKDLRELGFGFCCDSWGREHLRVPKTSVLVRLEGTNGDLDYFVRVEKEDEPRLLFVRPWHSTTTCPG